MRVTISDSRELVGTFMAFDKHMNLVLGDCEEFRTVKSRGTKRVEKQKRTLGLVLLRGESVISMTVEGPPPSTGKKKQVAPIGQGVARMAGRGSVIMHQQQQMQSAPRGLSGPIRGIGGPQPGMMRPQMMQGPPRGTSIIHTFPSLILHCLPFCPLTTGIHRAALRLPYEAKNRTREEKSCPSLSSGR